MSVSPTGYGSDMFKVIQTAPVFAYAEATGSYSSESFKNSYQFTTKDPDSGSTVKSVKCNQIEPA